MDFRSEYIQVIFGNQETHVEECLKKRSILNEFEKLSTANILPYVPDVERCVYESSIANIGAREHIFFLKI